MHSPLCAGASVWVLRGPVEPAGEALTDLTMDPRARLCGEGRARLCPLPTLWGLRVSQPRPAFSLPKDAWVPGGAQWASRKTPPPVLPLRQLPKHCRSGSQGRKLVSQSRPLVLGAGVWSHCHGAKTLPWSLFLPLPGACSPQNLMWAGARSVSISVGMVPSPLSPHVRLHVLDNWLPP